MGRQSIVTWKDDSFLAPEQMVHQASGLCFTVDGMVVLVTTDGEVWSLPGGHIEQGETIEQALLREVAEEACARVTRLAYLGAQEVYEQGGSAGPKIYYEARYWARVELGEFEPKFETTARKLVNPSEINESLRWKPSGILKAMLAAALAWDATDSKPDDRGSTG